MKRVQEKYIELTQIIDQLNSKVGDLSSSKIIFSEAITVQIKFTDPELCFNNLISWLYILGYESTGRNLDFIVKKIIPYGISISPSAMGSNRQIHAFRTVLQHNLDLTNSQSDIEKNNLCNSWFFEGIGKNSPENSEEWIECILLLLDQSIELFNAIFSCVNKIAKSEHLDIVINEWEKMITRNHSVYEYQLVLDKILQNLGLANFLNSNLIAKKYKDEWRKDIDLLPDGFNFEEEAYKIIERFILKRDLIPIDGNDLINLGVSPGKRLMELLIKAKIIFYDQPCDKASLISQVEKLI